MIGPKIILTIARRSRERQHSKSGTDSFNIRDNYCTCVGKAIPLQREFRYRVTTVYSKLFFMSIKVNAQKCNISFQKGVEKYAYVLLAILYSKLFQAKVINEASLCSGSATFEAMGKRHPLQAHCSCRQHSKYLQRVFISLAYRKTAISLPRSGQHFASSKVPCWCWPAALFRHPAD